MAKFKFIEPELIKAGDARLKLGQFEQPPKVDCRVLSEDTYQALKKAYDNERKGNQAKSENANCVIFDVSQQRELLLAFSKWLDSDENEFYDTDEEQVEVFLKAKQETIKPMAYDALLSTGLIRTLVEATGRFEFVREEAQSLIFYDEHWEAEQSLGRNWTLKQLMGWITNFYSEDFQWRGEEKIKRQMRQLIGVPD